MNDGWKDGGRKGLLTSDPNFTDCRIGQELDVLDALPQLIKRCIATSEQRTAVFRGFDASRAAVEQAHTERMLEFGYHLGDSGLGHSQRLSGFRHAAPLHGCEKDVQVP